MRYLNDRKNAFIYALSGLWQAFKKEAHIKIHFLAAIVVISAGLYFSITKYEWLAVSICIVLVIASELINTAMEKLCDIVMPDQHPTIKYIKDIMATVVLLTCILSVITGLVIFLPYF
jgi:diacylglycerol kinase